MAIDAAALREHIETDLGDDALDRLIADAYAFCEERAGKQGEQAVVLDGGERYLMLPFPISDTGDIEIVERIGDEETTVDPSDWRWNGGRTLERLNGGDLVFWGYAHPGGDVVVTYTPKSDADMRDRVVIDLCKLAIQHTGLHAERAGDYSSTHPEYARERDRIVRQLVPALGVA